MYICVARRVLLKIEIRRLTLPYLIYVPVQSGDPKQRGVNLFSPFCKTEDALQELKYFN